MNLNQATSMQRLQVLGFVLWRGGLFLVGGYIVYEGAMALLSAMEAWGIQLEMGPKTGLALVLSGLLFVIVSLIMERVQDARHEQLGDE